MGVHGAAAMTRLIERLVPASALRLTRPESQYPPEGLVWLFPDLPVAFPNVRAWMPFGARIRYPR